MLNPPTPAPVDSVNGQTGVVVLDAGDVGADPAGSAATAQANAEAYTDTQVAGIEQPPFAPSDIEGADTNARVIGKTSGTTYAEIIYNSTATFDSIPRRRASDGTFDATTPTSDSHVVNKQYVDALIAALQVALDEKLDLSGGTLTGELHMTEQKIVNVGDPDDPRDVVNLQTLEAASNLGLATQTGGGTVDLVADDAQVQLIDSTAGATLVQLPDTAVDDTPVGKVFTIKKTDASANAVTIEGGIDGNPTHVLTDQFDVITVVHDGTSYHLISNGGA